MSALSDHENFAERIPALLARLEAQLDQCLPQPGVYPARLHQAMRYATRGGKRLRGLLVYAAGEVMQVPLERLDTAACAVELIHAYSLVHDDLPAMDDDDLRRGQPTVHRQYDEALAILVGDALQTLAFGVLARQQEQGPGPAQRLRMIELLAEAAGSRGMVGGQAIDLASEGGTLSLPELEALHIHKTGALIRACLLLAAQARPLLAAEELAALDHFGKCIGLAFQIQDDVLDGTAATKTLGKTAGKDQAQLKSSYPRVMGLPEARRRARELFEDARATLAPFGARAKPLLCLAERIEDRGN